MRSRASSCDSSTSYPRGSDATDDDGESTPVTAGQRRLRRALHAGCWEDAASELVARGIGEGAAFSLALLVARYALRLRGFRRMAELMAIPGALRLTMLSVTNPG